MYVSFRPNAGEFWEVHELLRKLMLMGALVLLESTKLRMVVALLVCVVSTSSLNYDKMTATKNTTSTNNSNTNGLNEISKTMLGNLEIGVMMRLNHPRIVAFLGFGEIVDPPLEGDDVPRVGIFVINYDLRLAMLHVD